MTNQAIYFTLYFLCDIFLIIYEINFVLRNVAHSVVNSRIAYRDSKKI